MKAIRLTGLLLAAQAVLPWASARAQAPASVTPDTAGPTSPAAPPPSPPPGVVASLPPPVVASPSPAPIVPQVDPENPVAPPARSLARTSPPLPGEPERSAFLFLPTIGVHSFQNDSATNLDAGLRLGALVGARINDSLSLNAEATLDLVNPSNVPPGVDITALQFHIAFSPLIHATSGAVELVVGPKLGLFALSLDASGGGQKSSSSVHGWLYGVNVGAFGRVNDTLSMGALVSFDFERATEECDTEPGFSEMCTSSGFDNSVKVLGVGVALLF
jgi:hypothetical protein